MLYNLLMRIKTFVFTKDLLKIVNKRHYIANLLRYCQVFKNRIAGKGYATPIDYHNAVLLIIGSNLIDFGFNLRHVDTLLTGLNLVKFDKEREQLKKGYFLNIFRHHEAKKDDKLPNVSFAVRFDRDLSIINEPPKEPMSMIIIFDATQKNQKSRGAYYCNISKGGLYMAERMVIRETKLNEGQKEALKIIRELDGQKKTSTDKEIISSEQILVNFGFEDWAFLTIDLTSVLTQVDKVFS